MKKILVTGASGLVGSRFVELFSKKYSLFTPEYPKFDLLDRKKLEEIFESNLFDSVIHLAAYTDVSESERQKDNKDGLCWKVNYEGTKNLISYIDPLKTQFIYISTDTVFNGTGNDPGPYDEDHPVEKDKEKLTWYGYSKMKTEEMLMNALNKDFTILRLIYPVRAKYDLKLDYLRKPLELYNQGKLYPLFYDQQISISFIDEVSLALEKIIDNKFKSIFHASSTDLTTPYEIISYFIKKARKNIDKPIEKISLKQFLINIDNPVRYPEYGGLKVDKTEKILGIKYSSWNEIADKIVLQMRG